MLNAKALQREHAAASHALEERAEAAEAEAEAAANDMREKTEAAEKRCVGGIDQACTPAVRWPPKAPRSLFVNKQNKTKTHLQVAAGEGGARGAVAARGRPGGAGGGAGRQGGVKQGGAEGGGAAAWWVQVMADGGEMLILMLGLFWVGLRG